MHNTGIPGRPNIRLDIDVAADEGEALGKDVDLQ